MEGEVRFMVQEIDNNGTVIDADVAAGLTHEEAVLLVNKLEEMRERDGMDCGSWFATVPYTCHKEPRIEIRALAAIMPGNIEVVVPLK